MQMGRARWEGVRVPPRSGQLPWWMVSREREPPSSSLGKLSPTSKMGARKPTLPEHPDKSSAWLTPWSPPRVTLSREATLRASGGGFGIAPVLTSSSSGSPTHMRKGTLLSPSFSPSRQSRGAQNELSQELTRGRSVPRDIELDLEAHLVVTPQGGGGAGTGI